MIVRAVRIGIVNKRHMYSPIDRQRMETIKFDGGMVIMGHIGIGLTPQGRGI